MDARNEIGLICCESGKIFGNKILKEFPEICEKEGKLCNVKLIPTKETHFANTEIKTEIMESIRGMDIFIIQDVANKELRYSVDENIMALKTAIDATRMSDAKRIFIIMPTYPYARQDKAISRECITAALIAREIEQLGADRIITLDIHNPAIGGFFRNAILENLSARKTLVKYIKENLDISNMVVVAPDAGSVRRATKFAEDLQIPLDLMYKQRDYSQASTIAKTILVGNVEGKDCLIADDMIATGGTMLSAAKSLKEHGAKEIYVACALPFFDGLAKEKFDTAFKEGVIKLAIGTDAVRHSEEFLTKTKWYKETSVAKYFAKVIFNLNYNKSLSKLLE